MFKILPILVWQKKSAIVYLTSQTGLASQKFVVYFSQICQAHIGLDYGLLTCAEYGDVQSVDMSRVGTCLECGPVQRCDVSRVWTYAKWRSFHY